MYTSTNSKNDPKCHRKQKKDLPNISNSLGINAILLGERGTSRSDELLVFRALKIDFLCLLSTQECNSKSNNRLSQLQHSLSLASSRHCQTQYEKACKKQTRNIATAPRVHTCTHASCVHVLAYARIFLTHVHTIQNMRTCA